MNMNPNTTTEPSRGPAPVETILNLALGYLLSRSLHVATELGIADLLAAGPMSPEEIAVRTATHRPSLHRLLRTLAGHGVFAEEADGRFSNTPAAALLRQGVMRDGVLLCGEVTGDGSWWNAVGALRQSIATGEPAFERQHGRGFFNYLQNHPACREWFDRGMANFAAAENPAIAAALDYGRFAHLVDVGGGQGGLLAEIFRRHPRVSGTLFDLPDVVRQPAPLHDAAFAGRWAAAGGDFFQAVPPGADAYLLKRILHDWDDEHCGCILRNCRTAMGPQARLLAMDVVLPAGNAPHPGKVMDILMMVFARGRERTEEEFRALFAKAGLKLLNVTPTQSALSIIEAGIG